jgi:hypothetical protein
MIFEKTFGRLDRDAVADAGEGHMVGVERFWRRAPLTSAA